MAGTGKTSKLPQVAGPAAANFFLTGVTLNAGVHVATSEPTAMNAVSHRRHAFTNQGGADGILPVATTVKIRETWLEVFRNAGTRCVIELVNANTDVVHHSFDSVFGPIGGSDLWHWVHDPPIEFTVPANHLLITKVWINGTFHRLAALHIGTRS